ncbi:ankyrin repeat and SAM domain-containing protein 3 isoform X5 [Phocoena sinus]|uniref:Ankyrin repeat and SAM domain-containing protein 3 isoform X3 n=3 Tax=Odontoceti TaxID=9722 RepID=A0A6J3PYR4_TURTR|nr:ankyrin repeat and SAM domain-containing protein 3 isoform X2 [Lagenorhynchus obliquidens]XP_026973299.1 ankyrin repeat and SAM domain-containing protein 3 isoform X2 [Lagenorhynchus obliquidens]XP_032460774.1 ankyrin repeat and SAM domain-containing protein 3 isoform X5 [Phocoena sinus]XP_033695117.1 ankyrin repeat and SAM domain-containing protein 3 isoform X3 [Tursiops truncatus]XP_033695119.1 ankyrin repeat and SAM domain-containing protein 3 isoform X3 [Tursiops truncatus]
MSELSDEASEPELLNRSLSMWHGLGAQVSREELAVPLDLHTAASIGQYEVVKECVQRRELDLNKKNGGGWTPLMYASYIGHDTIVHLLLEAGVSVNVPTPEGQTPLMLASSCGNESIAYFLLQQGAELEMKDIQGWTALFHCTSAGHQQMVKFLLDSGANANVREPVYGFTPLMEAAAAGHEIIVQYFLNHGVKVDTRDHSGATARMLAKQYGHMKIVGLIDAHSPSLPKSLYRSPEKYEDLSSSDESCPVPQRQRPCRKKGLSIHEGPRALARLTAIGLGGRIQQPCYEQVPPRGYVTFNSSDENPLEEGGLCYRDVTSPINERDVESSSSSSREEHAFCAHLGAARSSSSSEGLARAPELSSEASLESNEDSDHARKSSVRKQTKSYVKTKNRYSSSDSQWPPGTGTSCAPRLIPQTDRSPYSGPQDLATLLEQIGCLKYLQVFEEQDVDLRIFLTLTESDLKEIGITLFGPKRKMTSAIARWHSSARPPSDALELAYADRLEAEMQELAIQLHKRCEEVEAMRGLVSQEQELRAVVESCLLEQDGARKDVHAQLQETWALARDAALVLDQLQACQAELSARVQQDESPLEAMLGPGLPTADSKGWQAALQALSLPQLSGALEDRVREMGRVLCLVTQSLEKLQVLNGKENWREP